jgi:xylan 1,4-beta-xylosidase
VLEAQAMAAEAKLPFFITEYNDGLGASSRDDASAAAFVIRHVGLMEKLDMFSWWTFSDGECNAYNHP